MFVTGKKWKRFGRSANIKKIICAVK